MKISCCSYWHSLNHYMLKTRSNQCPLAGQQASTQLNRGRRLSWIFGSGKKFMQQEGFVIPTPSKVNYINAQYGLKSWLLTKDHKRIALLYLASVTAFFFFGGIYAMMIRIELLTPRGDFLSSATYNKVFTQHGILMIFFFLIPAIPQRSAIFLCR